MKIAHRGTYKQWIWEELLLIAHLGHLFWLWKLFAPWKFIEIQYEQEKKIELNWINLLINCNGEKYFLRILNHTESAPKIQCWIIFLDLCPKQFELLKIIWTDPKSFWTYRRTRQYFSIKESSFQCSTYFNHIHMQLVQVNNFGKFCFVDQFIDRLYYKAPSTIM